MSWVERVSPRPSGSAVERVMIAEQHRIFAATSGERDSVPNFSRWLDSRWQEFAPGHGEDERSAMQAGFTAWLKRREPARDGWARIA